MIVEPRYVSLSTAPLYIGDLDVDAYELLPDDVAGILGATNWTTMSRLERSQWAYSRLDPWPTMVELLNQLAIRAEQVGNVTVSSVVRDRGQASEAIFARSLYHYLRNVDRTFRGFAALASIMSIALGSKNLTSKAVRGMILGPSGKTTH